MSMRTLRCRALATLIAAGALSGPAMACLEIPPIPPDIWIVVTGPNDADVIIHNFTTYGSTAGTDYCACALNVPALYGEVVSATIVDSSTGLPLPGFSFGQDTDTQTGFQGAAPLSPPEFWSGFSSAVSTTIASGLEVDIVFHINSQDRPFDWNGLADQLQDATSVLATDAADPDGTPTGAHQSIQPAGAVGVEVNAFGMPHRPLGQATLTRSGGQLVVSNIGSSGKDGVSIAPPPDTQGAGVQIGPNSCPAGGSPPGRGIGLRSFNVDSFFDIFYEVSISDRWTAQVNTPVAPVCMQVQVYDQGELQLDQCVPPGQPLMDFSSGVCLTQLAWLQMPTPRMRLLLDQQTPIQVGGAATPVDGDELHIFNPDESLTPPALYELYALTDSFFDIWIEAESIQMFDNQHLTLGDGLYEHNNNGQLIISNLGSSGLDGVRSVPLPHPRFQIDSFFDVFTELVVDPDPGGGAPNLSYVEYSATGPVQGSTQPAPLGSMRATKTGAGHQVSADFSPVGASTTRLEVYNDGVLVEEFNGLSNASWLFRHQQWPESVGKLSSGWPPGLSCFVQTWPIPVTLSVNGFPGRGLETNVDGDEVRILAEGGTPVDGVSSMSMQGAGYPSVALTGQTTSPPSDSDLDGVPDGVDNCVLESNPTQCDTDGDGFGNHCDADLDNNNTVNTFDLNIMRANFGASGANDADLNCDNSVNTFDLSRMRNAFGLPPGPSGL